MNKVYEFTLSEILLENSFSDSCKYWFLQEAEIYFWVGRATLRQLNLDSASLR